MNFEMLVVERWNYKIILYLPLCAIFCSRVTFQPPLVENLLYKRFLVTDFCISVVHVNLFASVLASVYEIRYGYLSTLRWILFIFYVLYIIVSESIVPGQNLGFSLFHFSKFWIKKQKNSCNYLRTHITLCKHLFCLISFWNGWTYNYEILYGDSWTAYVCILIRELECNIFIILFFKYPRILLFFLLLTPYKEVL